MKLKVFYSWQSQTNPEYNHHFIHECIRLAIRNLKEMPETSHIEYILTDSTRDEPGAPPIASQIKGKIIPDSDIFIGDISTSNYETWLVRQFMRNYRPAPNLNVYDEFVNALTKGHERVISVMNEVYGTPKDLPFDVQHLKVAARYSLKNKKKIDTAKVLLTDILTEKIRLVSIFCIRHIKERFLPLINWDTWEKIIPQNYSYIANPKIEEVAHTIKKAVTVPGEIIRVLGLSGLGKTRMMFELFRPNDDDYESIKLSGRILYFDCNDNIQGLKYKISEVISSGNEYVIILDNCTKAFCINLINITRGKKSNISLITLDNNPEEFNVGKINGISYIQIDKSELSEVVDYILEKDFNELSPEKIQKIKEFSQGIPLMAVLLGERIRAGEEFLGPLNDNELIEKLLGEFGKDPEIKTLLKSSSLFSNFGYEEELEEQFNFIATNRDLTITGNAPEVSKERFRETINHYLDRKIFEKKGRFIGMRPFPLALHLAQEWLSTCTSRKMNGLLIAIANLDQPHRSNISEAFAEQMRHLGYDDKAKKIVEELVRAHGPFGNAEVLNTELGSRLFRAFVEVNPVAIAKNLETVFNSISDEQILRIDEGRRNLVWVLEKLCFDKRTFEKGIKLIYRFAVSENETWGNNATGQFLHLFNILLSGTQAIPREKLRIIDWGFDHSEEKYKVLAIKAMGNALSFGSFMRISGAEIQGSKTLEDYQPTFTEIEEYWRGVIERLLDLIKTGGKLSDLAADMLIPSLRGIVNAGFSNLISGYIPSLIANGNPYIEKTIEALKSILRYESTSLGDDHIQFFNDIIKNNTREDFLSRYIRMVVKHHFDFSLDHSEEKIQLQLFDLASQLFKEKLDWKDVVPMFYNNRQYGSYLFGRGLAIEFLKNESLLDRFLSLSVEILIDKGQEETNLAVLGGIAVEMGEVYADQIENYFLPIENLHYVIFYLISLRKEPYLQTDRLFGFVNNGTAKLSDFLNLGNNGQINPIFGQIEKFIKEIFEYGTEGYLVAFKLLFTFVFWNKDLRDAANPLLRECILNLEIVRHDRQIDKFQWWEAVKGVLSGRNDTEFAHKINHHIINSITWKNSYHLDNSVQTVYAVLMREYFDTVWPRVSQDLLSVENEYIKFYGLKHILGSSIGGVRRANGILFEGNIDEIFKWANANKPLGPSRLAELAPIFAEKGADGKAHWSTVSKRIIDEFGEFNEVLSSLDSNVGTFSWTGSTVDYYLMQIDLMDELIDHPNQNVREWTQRKRTDLEMQIKHERNRDEEYGIL